MLEEKIIRRNVYTNYYTHLTCIHKHKHIYSNIHTHKNYTTKHKIQCRYILIIIFKIKILSLVMFLLLDVTIKILTTFIWWVTKRLYKRWNSKTKHPLSRISSLTVVSQQLCRLSKVGLLLTRPQNSCTHHKRRIMVSWCPWNCYSLSAKTDTLYIHVQNT